ncbi:MAG TPA: lanthionine synthetase LanC family protein [Myxococcales bacterium]|nr:lanthionine synthetase LanC family protein [Myxococcales bacterium]
MNAPPPRLSRWRRDGAHPSLAHGWLGAAWVAEKLAAAGRIAPGPRWTQALRRRLCREDVPLRRPDRTSHLVGSGGVPLLLAYVARRSPRAAPELKRAVARWRALCERSPKHDVMAGASGALLAAAEIERIAPGAIPAAFAGALRERSAAGLAAAVAGGRAYLGMAHGVAGYLLALETAGVAFGHPLPSRLRRRALDRLEAERLDGPDRSAAWPAVATERDLRIQGWCHGAAGIALALTCCHALTSHRRYGRLAAPALNGASAYSTGHASFCCGDVGRAQVLIEAYRLTGRRAWLRRARAIAGGIRFRARGRFSLGFHRGRLGFDYLGHRLAAPARLPLPGLGVFSAGC